MSPGADGIEPNSKLASQLTGIFSMEQPAYCNGADMMVHVARRRTHFPLV